MSIAAFYKIDNGMLLIGVNRVLNAEYELFSENHDQYQLPIDGWYWFNTTEQACAYFGIEVPKEEPKMEYPKEILP